MKNPLLFGLLLFVSFQARATIHDSIYVHKGIDSVATTVSDTISSVSAEQHIDSVFMLLDTSFITTGLLIDRTISTFNFHNYQGDTSTDSAADYPTCLRIVNVMNGSAVDTSHRQFNPLAWYIDTALHYYNSLHEDPFMLVAANFNKIDTNAIDSGLLFWGGGLLQDVPGRPRSPYLKKSLDVREKLIYIHLQYL